MGLGGRLRGDFHNNSATASHHPAALWQLTLPYSSPSQPLKHVLFFHYDTRLVVFCQALIFAFSLFHSIFHRTLKKTPALFEQVSLAYFTVLPLPRPEEGREHSRQRPACLEQQHRHRRQHGEAGVKA